MMNTELRLRLDRMMANSAFIRHWGLEITDARPDEQMMTMRMHWRPEAEGDSGTGLWHGGPIASLIDTAGCFAAIMLVQHDANTLGLNIDYLRPAAGSHLEAIARVRKSGRRTSTVEIDVVDAAGKLVAVGRGTYFIRTP